MPNWNDKWWENTYDKVLQSIKHNEKDDDDDDISSQDTQAEMKKNKHKNNKQHNKSKLSKIEKEVTLLNKKRKITFISI
jgi:hypothetical protein